MLQDVENLFCSPDLWTKCFVEPFEVDVYYTLTWMTKIGPVLCPFGTRNHLFSPHVGQRKSSLHPATCGARDKDKIRGC